MSIRFIRTAVLNNGADLPRCIGWAKELNSYIEKKYDVEVHFGVQQFASGQVVWMTDQADIGTFDDVMSRMMQDQDYWKLVEQGRDLFVPGSLRDQIFKLI